MKKWIGGAEGGIHSGFHSFFGRSGGTASLLFDLGLSTLRPSTLPLFAWRSELGGRIGRVYRRDAKGAEGRGGRGSKVEGRERRGRVEDRREEEFNRRCTQMNADDEEMNRRSGLTECGIHSGFHSFIRRVFSSTLDFRLYDLRLFLSSALGRKADRKSLPQRAQRAQRDAEEEGLGIGDWDGRKRSAAGSIVYDEALGGEFDQVGLFERGGDEADVRFKKPEKLAVGDVPGGNKEKAGRCATKKMGV